ncbi:SCO family protein [Aurantibacillus circumpalustris]|uniref:SCO family protein n=1 Tax=Aurantibacillus circumpalustris TaxID=3036359 RepID=UPI00295A8C1E|nr:SCO family protein [Aurantibacillus circumpalustris]
MKLNQIRNAVYALPFLLGVSCKQESPKLLLPVYGEKKISTDEKKDTLYHTIGEFNLINQYDETVSKETVKNKIYVANFFFATCQSICPEMSTNLTDVQKAFADDDSLLILSHSVNPLHDTVEVLMDYASTYKASKNKWHLLTGDKKHIYDLAKTSYLVNAFEDDGSPEGFLHSELFLLIDKKGRMRGMYDGTDKAQVQKLIEDIRLLKKE